MKCAIYTRVSTDEQGSSLANQREYFQDYVKRNRFEIFDIYSDEAFSGTEVTKRRSFQRLLEDGKNRRYDVLLAKSYSRFGRNQRETLTALAVLFESGVRIIFIEDGLDSARDKGQFGLFAWLAEQESRKISERIRLTWQLYDREGKIHATNAPLGYDYSREQKNFIVNEKEAEIVKLIFTLYAQGSGIRKIAVYLNENGYSTKHGHQWSHTVVRQTLTNGFYMGTLTQGKRKKIDVTLKKLERIDKEEWQVHRDHHEALISPEEFDKVQAQYKQRAQYTGENRSSRHSSAHLFSNVAVCGLCGATLTFKNKKGENHRPKYSCIAYEQKGVTGCGHRNNAIPEDLLIRMVKEELEAIGDASLKEIGSHYERRKRIPSRRADGWDVKKLEAKIREKTNLSLELLNGYAKGLIGEAQFKLQNEAIEKDLREWAEKMEAAEKWEALRKNEEKGEQAAIIKGLWSLDRARWTNEMIKGIVRKIEVNMRDGDVHIFFRFAGV